MTNILITGGAGFVGANLACYFKERGHEVVAFDNLSRKGSEINIPRLLAKNVKFVVGDCATDDIERMVFEYSPNVILHCAAQPSAIAGLKKPMVDFKSNVVGTMNVVEACRKQNVGLIYWSTNKVYPDTRINPQTTLMTPTSTSYSGPIEGFNENECVINGNGGLSTYGATKLAGEILTGEWSKRFDFPCIINRFSCIGGKYQWGVAEQGWMAWFVIAHKFNLPIKIEGWKGKQVRDVLDIRDLNRLVEEQVETMLHINRQGKYRGDVFNVGGGKHNQISILDALEFLKKSYGYSPRITIDDTIRPSDHAFYVSDIRKLCSEFDWRPQFTPYECMSSIKQWVEEDKDKLSALYMR